MKEIETQLAKKKNSNYLDRPYLIFMFVIILNHLFALNEIIHSNIVL